MVGGRRYSKAVDYSWQPLGGPGNLQVGGHKRAAGKGCFYRRSRLNPSGLWDFFLAILIFLSHVLLFLPTVWVQLEAQSTESLELLFEPPACRGTQGIFSLQGLSVMNFHRGFLNLPSRLVMILLVCIRVGNRALCPKM